MVHYVLLPVIYVTARRPVDRVACRHPKKRAWLLSIHWHRPCHQI